MARSTRTARTASVRTTALAGAVVVGDGGVDVSVPRDETSSHVVSAETGDGKVTVRTAN
ncbi:hypothetical protein [Streptomyces sp. NPDC002788]